MLPLSAYAVLETEPRASCMRGKRALQTELSLAYRVWGTTHILGVRAVQSQQGEGTWCSHHGSEDETCRWKLVMDVKSCDNQIHKD